MATRISFVVPGTLLLGLAGVRRAMGGDEPSCALIELVPSVQWLDDAPGTPFIFESIRTPNISEAGHIAFTARTTGIPTFQDVSDLVAQTGFVLSRVHEGRGKGKGKG